MDDEILKLLRENNKLLKEAISILESINKENRNDIKDFIMNVIANLVASILEKNNNIMNVIKKNFRL